MKQSADTLILLKDFYLAYFGKSKEYYWEKVVQHSKGFRLTFNIWAFLFPLFWFAYRKMYYALIALIVIYLLNGLVAFSQSFFILFVIRLAVALMADKLYISQAASLIAKSKENSNIRGHQVNFLREKGGVSKENVWILIFSLFLVSFGLVAFKIYKILITT